MNLRLHNNLGKNIIPSAISRKSSEKIRINGNNNPGSPESVCREYSPIVIELTNIDLTRSHIKLFKTVFFE